MKKRFGVLAAVCWLWTGGALGAPAPRAKKVAVLEIEAKVGIDQARCDVFAEFLQKEMRSRGIDVVGKSEIQAVLGVDQMKDKVSCDTDSCLAAISGALGVDEIVHGVIAKMGSDLLITLKRTSHVEARVIQQATRKLPAGSDDDLLGTIDPLVDELFGAKNAGAYFTPQRITAISLTGVGIASLVTGGIFEIVAGIENAHANDAKYLGRQVAAQNVPANQTRAVAFAATGAAVAAVGAVWWILTPQPAAAMVLPVSDAKSLGVVFSSQF